MKKGEVDSCPKCEQRMETVTFATVEVNRCRGCRGLWFDTMEQERLAKIEGSESIDIGDPAVGKQFDSVDRIDCPRCRIQMIRVVDARNPHIHLESCKVCYGVFLDAGELRDTRERTLVEVLRDLISDGERPLQFDRRRTLESRSRMIKDRRNFVDRIQREIEDWEAKLEPLKLKAKLGEMETRERFEALEESVTAATRPIRTKLKELKYETGEAWMDIAGGCESAWSEAKAAIKSAIARYTD